MEIKKAKEIKYWNELKLNKEMRDWCCNSFQSLEHLIYYGRAVAFCPVRLGSSVSNKEIKLALALDKAGFIHHFDVETLSAWLMFDEILSYGLRGRDEFWELDREGIKFIFTPFVNSGFSYLPYFRFSCPDGIPWEKFNENYERNPWFLTEARKNALFELAQEIGGEEIEVIGRHFGLFGYEKLELRYGSFGPKVKAFTEIARETGRNAEKTRKLFCPKILLNDCKDDRLVEIFRPNYSIYDIKRELEKYHNSLMFHREKELMRVLQLHSLGDYAREVEKVKAEYYPGLNTYKEGYLVKELGLSTRVYNIVSCFRTVDELMENLEKLPKFRQLGLVGIAEVKQKLAEHGFLT